MTLVHAFTVVLTVLLFIVRHRYALAGNYLEKRRNIRQQGSQNDSCDKPITGQSSSAVFTPVELKLFLTNPKYKRDPEIDVDSEEIGYDPLL